MQFKSAQEYNPLNYACYAVTSVKEDFTLNTVHPNGLQQYLDYDVYDIGDKNLIAFTKINFYKTYFVFRLISENYTEDINAENYEYVADVLDESYDESKYTFHIMESAASFQEAVGDKVTSIEDSRRCDLEDFAAVDFYDVIADGKPDLLDRNYFNNDNILGWALFLASMGNIYIVKLEFADIEDRAYKDWSASTLMAQTFMHAVKMAYEWNILAEEPWNSNQKVALKSNAAFKDWNMSEEILEEISSLSPNTSIGMYLSSDPDPRRSIIEDKTISPKFKNWYISKLRYRTLGSLSQNYPEDLDIPSSMIEKEKTFFETEIYKFCIENELDILSTTSVDILDKAYCSGPSYKEKNNTITDIIGKNIYLQDRELIKEYQEIKKKPFATYEG
jgi:hypothetical protein